MTVRARVSQRESATHLVVKAEVLRRNVAETVVHQREKSELLLRAGVRRSGIVARARRRLLGTLSHILEILSGELHRNRTGQNISIASLVSENELTPYSTQRSRVASPRSCRISPS